MPSDIFACFFFFRHGILSPQHFEPGAFTVLADYGYVGILLVAAILFTILLLLIPLTLSLLGVVPRKSNPVKTSTYECGLETIGKTWVQFNFRYYLFAILFVALDVLTIFLYPWAVNLRGLGLFGFIAMVAFFIILLVGYVYAWRKGALEWK
jgi:NADH-quinone oxidoreductase subunit A